MTRRACFLLQFSATATKASILMTNRYARYEWRPEPPAGRGWAVTARSLNFGGQPLFPPGIDLDVRPTPGPWFDLYAYDSANPCTEGPGPSRGANRNYFNQSGIVWFAGSVPLYRMALVGVRLSATASSRMITCLTSVTDSIHRTTCLDNSTSGTPKDARARPYVKFPKSEFGSLEK